MPCLKIVFVVYKYMMSRSNNKKQKRKKISQITPESRAVHSLLDNNYDPHYEDNWDLPPSPALIRTGKPFLNRPFKPSLVCQQFRYSSEHSPYSPNCFQDLQNNWAKDHQKQIPRSSHKNQQKFPKMSKASSEMRRIGPLTTQINRGATYSQVWKRYGRRPREGQEFSLSLAGVHIEQTQLSEQFPMTYPNGGSMGIRQLLHILKKNPVTSGQSERLSKFSSHTTDANMQNPQKKICYRREAGKYYNNYWLSKMKEKKKKMTQIRPVHSYSLAAKGLKVI